MNINRHIQRERGREGEKERGITNMVSVSAANSKQECVCAVFIYGCKLMCIFVYILQSGRGHVQG